MNLSLLYFLNSFVYRNQTLDSVIYFFAVTFGYVVVVVAVVYLLNHYKVFKRGSEGVFNNKVKAIASVALSIGLAQLVGKGLKFLFHTERPFVALGNINNLFMEIGYAFPSNHAAFFSALAFSIFFINKKWGYFFIVCALFIGIARIIAGVHYPIDILGGYILGFLIAYIIQRLFK